MNTKTLIDRLELLCSVERFIEAPVELLFDEDAWRSGHKEVEIIEGLYQKRAPDEVFARLRELNKTPHSYFGLRKGLVAKVKAYRKRTITPQEVAALFEEGDKMTLGEFTPLGRADDFFTCMNQWYYGALGEEAFTREGQVPVKLPNDPLIQQANARNLYEKIIQGDFGKDEPVIVQKWGSGGLLEPVLSFLEEIIRLDEQRGTQVYHRLRYVISDISQKSIDDSRSKAQQNKKAQEHLKAGVLAFEVSDARRRDSSGNAGNAEDADDTWNTRDAAKDKHTIKSRGVANIESSYLYDSISQPMVTKVNGKWYELQYRAYIDTRNGNRFATNKYQSILPEEFKRWLVNNDLEKLSTLRPGTFEYINWEVKLVEIDIEQYPHGRTLERMMHESETQILPTGTTNLESLRQAAQGLKPHGYIQVFDLDIVDTKKSTKNSKKKSKTGAARIVPDIMRYNGCVYSHVNFELIAQELKKDGLDVRVEHITDYLENILGERVIPVIALSDCAKDAEAFDTYFPLKMMRAHQWIKDTAQRIQRSQGYSDAGRANFYWELHNAGLTKWCHNSWFDHDGDEEDYITDYRKTLRSTMYYRAFECEPLWIFERTPNEAMMRRFEMLGFTPKIIPHLFQHHQEISANLNYYHLLVRKMENKKDAAGKM